jgi:hypothetical protein
MHAYTGEDLNQEASTKLSGFPHELIRKDFTQCTLHAELMSLKESRPQCTRMILAMFLLPEALSKLASELKECIKLCDVIATIRWPIADIDNCLWQADNEGGQDGYWLYRNPHA